MTDNPPKDETPNADAAFNRTLKNLLTTPHKPHVKSAESESAQGGKKRAAPKSGPKSG